MCRSVLEPEVEKKTALLNIKGYMAPARERAQRALGVWDVLFMHCCDSKARQHSPILQCRPKGLPKATKEFEVRSINIAFKRHFAL